MKKNKLYMGLILGTLLLTGTSCTKPSGNGNVVYQDETITLNQELISNEKCTIEVLKMEKKSTRAIFDVKFTNNFSDKVEAFSLSDVAVDSYMTPSARIYATINPKETITKQFTVFPDHCTDMCQEVRFSIVVSDNDDLLLEAYIDQEFTIYPTGKNAETVSYPDRTRTKKEAEFIDNEMCNGVVLSAEDESNKKIKLTFYFENKLDKHMFFYISNFKLDGSSETSGGIFGMVSINSCCKSYEEIFLTYPTTSSGANAKVSNISFDFKFLETNYISDTPLCETSFVYNV